MIASFYFMKIITSIIGIISYFVLGWIFKDIVYSVIPVTDTTVLVDYLNYEIIVYSVLTLVICFLVYSYPWTKAESSDEEWPFVVSLFLITLMGFCFYYQWLPASTGLILLYNIINIGCIILCSVCNDDL